MECEPQQSFVSNAAIKRRRSSLHYDNMRIMAYNPSDCVFYDPYCIAKIRPHCASEFYSIFKSLHLNTCTFISPTEFPYFNYKYIVSDNALSWSDARQHCWTLAGELLSITDKTEQEIVKRILHPSQSYWIGMTDKGTGVQPNFVWIDGQEVLYKNWKAGEPSNPSEKCGSILQGSNGQWNDATCKDKLKFICKVPSKFSL